MLWIVRLLLKLLSSRSSSAFVPFFILVSCICVSVWTLQFLFLFCESLMRVVRMRVWLCVRSLREKKPSFCVFCRPDNTRQGRKRWFSDLCKWTGLSSGCVRDAAGIFHFILLQFYFRAHHGSSTIRISIDRNKTASYLWEWIKIAKRKKNTTKTKATKATQTNPMNVNVEYDEMGNE